MNVHVCEPFEIPSGWERLRSMDWGFTKPYAVYGGAVDYDGVVYIVNEYYGCVPGSPDTGTKETAREVANKIKHLNGYGVADPAIWQRTGHDGPTIQEIFAEEGVVFDKADNDRLAGKMQVHIRLREQKLVIFSTCTNLIRTLPALVYDKRHVEDVDTTQEDHAYDALRYMLMSRPITPSVADTVIQDGYKEDDIREVSGAWGV